MFDLDRWNEIWETIARNKKRSIMTALGVFWGIFMLVVMLGLGMGLGNMALASLGGMSTNTAFIFTDQTSVPYRGMPRGRWWNFDNKDLEDIRKQVPAVEYIAGLNWGRVANFSHNERKGEYYAMGYTADYARIMPQNITKGRFINEIDVQERRKVCVIGSQIWRELFPGGEDPIGKMILMNGIYVRIVGVIEKHSANIQFGDDPEKSAYLPSSLMQQLYNRGSRIDMIAFSAYDNYNVVEVEKDVKRLLAANHIVSPDDPKAFSGFNLGEQFNQVNGLFKGISLLTWIVGLGTLLAGIVGVSNIMLVIVRERTQEIGVRRALGAPPSSIISQILSESFILTFVAGVLGLTLAVGVLSIVDKVIVMIPEMPLVSFQVSFWTAMLATVIIILGSVAAGLIPAGRALKIKAVDAIREE